MTSIIEPTEGALTWECEGTEGGPCNSRVLSVPTNSSGLTLGRGYDMANRDAATIAADLAAAGVAQDDAERISKAAGLKGDAARAFIRDNALSTFEISPEAQEALFTTTYDAQAAETKRLCTKADVVAKYGATNWDALDPAIKEVLVDLKFRGDYDARAREIVQKHVSANDLKSFSIDLCDRGNWPAVPPDRFARRKEFIQSAVQGDAHNG
jgi:hypothetical protein